MNSHGHIQQRALHIVDDQENLLDDDCSLFCLDYHDVFNIVAPESQVSRLRNKKDLGTEGRERKQAQRQAHTEISEAIVL